jgi:hypothetical protein
MVNQLPPKETNKQTEILCSHFMKLLHTVKYILKICNYIKFRGHILNGINVASTATLLLLEGNCKSKVAWHDMHTEVHMCVYKNICMCVHAQAHTYT